MNAIRVDTNHEIYLYQLSRWPDETRVSGVSSLTLLVPASVAHSVAQIFRHLQIVSYTKLNTRDINTQTHTSSNALKV